MLISLLKTATSRSAALKGRLSGPDEAGRGILGFGPGQFFLQFGQGLFILCNASAQSGRLLEQIMQYFLFGFKLGLAFRQLNMQTGYLALDLHQGHGLPRLDSGFWGFQYRL